MPLTATGKGPLRDATRACPLISRGRGQLSSTQTADTDDWKRS